jgi:MATE family multidrug resistance protein
MQCSFNHFGGVDSGAAHQALRQIWTLLAYLLDAFAATAQTLIAFFLGASRIDLARRVARVACGWALATGVLVAGGMLALEHPVALLLVPAAAHELFAGAWVICAVAQPLNAVAFVTDGIHWGTSDFPYLRNAMLVSTAVGLGLLWTLDPADPHALRHVWWVTAIWIGVRATFGAARIWPNRAGIPLGISEA